MEIGNLVKGFGRILNVEAVANTPDRWTFWTYAERSAEISSEDGHRIRRRMRHHAKHIAKKVESERRDVAARPDERQRNET